jgi:hypothetical protein
MRLLSTTYQRCTLKEINVEGDACTEGYNEFDFSLENEEHRPFDGAKLKSRHISLTHLIWLQSFQKLLI